MNGVRHALDCLLTDHVQNNKHRLGALGAMDIDSAVAALTLMAAEPEPVEVKPNPKCACRECNPDAWWMVVCGICGNKRCPHATHHDHTCTGSNEPGQPGSVFK